MRRLSLATSPGPSVLGPLLYPGRVAECIEVAARLGYDGIEISLRASAELDARGLKRALKSAGLTLSALGSGRAYLEDKLSFSDPDPEVREAAVERLNGHIDLAAEHGALVIFGLMRGVRPWTKDGDLENELIVECLRRCAEYAQSVDVGLVVEPINRYETAFQNTAGQTLDLIERVGCPNVNVLLDLFHMNIEEVSLGDAIRRTGDRLRYVHIADSNRWAPGLGHMDYSDVIAALDDINYNGWLSAEVLPIPDDLSAARQAREHVARLRLLGPA